MLKLAVVINIYVCMCYAASAAADDLKGDERGRLPTDATRREWCSTDVRKVMVELDIDPRAQQHVYTTHVPAYFQVGDDIDEIAKAFAQIYLLGDEGELAARMKRELASTVDDSAVTENAPCMDPKPSRFYVEIGTSDFGTLHHQFYDDPMWEGVAVEPLAELLEALPLRPGLYAENAAFGCAAMGVDELTLYALERETVARLGLPHWALGTGNNISRLGTPKFDKAPRMGRNLNSARCAQGTLHVLGPTRRQIWFEPG